jgi:hypothetical protein
MGPRANGALCVSTPKHNGKSGPDEDVVELKKLICYTHLLNLSINLIQNRDKKKNDKERTRIRDQVRGPHIT